MNPMFPAENARGKENEKKTNHISAFAIDRVTHDIVNQLSIICLCCCELRDSLAEKLLSNQLNELGKIEAAVQAAAKMIEELKAILQDHEPAPTKLASVLNRVEATDSFYSLCPTLYYAGNLFVLRPTPPR
jgi:hypothetical protein